MSNSPINVSLFANRRGQDQLGRFGMEIAEHFANQDITVLVPDSEARPDVVIYASRTNEALEKAVDLANSSSAPFVLASSSMLAAARELNPSQLIFAPNCDESVLKFIGTVSRFANYHPEMTAMITEYHQETKKDDSQTALRIADLIGSERTRIVSVRNLGLVNKGGFYITEERAKRGYAIHVVEFFIQNCVQPNAIFQKSVYGRSAYAQGMAEIVKRLCSKDFQFVFPVGGPVKEIEVTEKFFT